MACPTVRAAEVAVVSFSVVALTAVVTAAEAPDAAAVDARSGTAEVASATADDLPPGAALPDGAVDATPGPGA